MRLRRKNKEAVKNAHKKEAKIASERKFPALEFKLGKTFQSILDGTILTRDQVINLLPFIFFLVFLAVGLIANTYHAERLIRSIDHGNKDLKELQIEYISSREKLMNISRVSVLTRRLEGKGIKEAKVPPFRINIEPEEER